MTTPLRDGAEASEGGLVIVAPGLEGSVEARAPEPVGTRGEGFRLDLAAFGFMETNAVALDATVVAPLRPPTTDVRAEAVAGEPGVVLVTVAEPSPDWAQALAVEDPVTGVLTWAFAEPARGEATTRGGSATRTYAVRVTPSRPPAEAAGSRGLVGAIVKKIIRVVVFKIADVVIGRIATYFARRWEECNRPYHLCSVGATARELSEVTADDWARAGRGRVLLLLHGTASSTANGFQRLPAATLAALRERYDGGILAFDHFTVSASPVENVRWLLDQVPHDVRLDVDVVCHSRGGLVGRVLAENHQGEFDLSRVNVRRAVFVATPNAGTPLADTEHMGALLDTLTFVFRSLPDNPATDGIDLMLEVVKDVAAAAVDGLAGLQAMRPSGDFLANLNAVTPATAAAYFGIGANYEPADEGVKMWAVDRVADAAFTQFANDLVVPTEGVFQANGAVFPQTHRYAFTTGQSTHHCNYFDKPEVSARLLDWLPRLERSGA